MEMETDPIASSIRLRRAAQIVGNGGVIAYPTEAVTGFNARYLLDAISATASKELVLELRDELTPAQIRPADDPDTLAVIMPMRL